LDEIVIMPNHIHGIVVIAGNIRAKDFSPLHSASTKWLKHHFTTARWQHADRPEGL
jgi:REP element-mobilizing transposase RayT